MGIVLQCHFFLIFIYCFRSLFTHHLLYRNRLIVTDSAQCGAWGSWAASNKKSRNARTSHLENPANSDAVQFFFHTLTLDPYVDFNMKASIYSHFEQLLSTPDKPLKLSDENFSTKVNPRRSYPECTINTGTLFDEDGDPIFVEVASTPVSPNTIAGKAKKGAKKTGSSLKRTLGASTTSRKKKSKKTAEQLPNDQLPSQPPPETPIVPTIITPVLPIIAEPAVQPVLPPTSTAPKKQKLYRYPSVLALPSKTAIPIDKNDASYLQCSFLPTSSAKGNTLFNAFITFTTNCENNCVLVSRAFASNTITRQDCHIAVRQVCPIFLRIPPSTFR